MRKLALFCLLLAAAIHANTLSISPGQLQVINNKLQQKQLPGLYAEYSWWWPWGDETDVTESDKLSTSEKIQRLEDITFHLNDEIVAQGMAKDVLLHILMIDAAGLKDEEKPIGSCLFLGPSGVGKTIVAKTTAKYYFGNENSFLLVNMAEFSASHETSKLIGSPPGYVGYNEGGLLTNFLLDHPRSVIILDEFEKAHPTVQKLFLSVFDQGILYGGDKTQVDCSQALFIATSNMESQRINSLIQAGDTPEEALSRVERYITKAISPELYGRMTKAVFSPLDSDNLADVYRMEIRKVCDNLKKKKNINLIVDASVRDHILDIDYNTALGARPMIDAIHHDITSAISYFLLYNKYSKDQTIFMAFQNHEYCMSIK